METPGSLLGNGLVFAGAPKDLLGTSGPRTALDPSIGDVVAGDVPPADGEGESSRVIALFGEHLVRSQGSDIFGEDLEGRRLWTRAAEDFGMSASEAREVPWEPIGDSHALLGEAGSQARTLIDLHSGATVDAEVAEAWFDSSSDTLVSVGSHLRGLDADGTQRWATPLPENAEVAAVGAGLIAFDSGSGRDADHPEPSPTARSARDGSAIEGETPLLTTIARLGAPHLISESGAALIGDPQTPLLVTSQS